MSDNGAFQAQTTASKITLPTQARILFFRNDLFPTNADEVWVIAVTANQVSPADLRWYCFGVY